MNSASRAQAVVLAGGLATRLGERARDTPKYLVEVAGRPFAHWQLERLAASGYHEVVLCIGHLGDRIRAALGDSVAGLLLRYVEDAGGPLGTGGALRGALPWLDEEFLCTYGDSYLPFDYRAPLDDLRRHGEAGATMAVYRNAGRWDDSNVRVDGERVIAYRKGAADMQYIDYGAIALRRSVLAELPEGHSDLGALLAALAARGQMRALVAPERFYEIGSPVGLAALEEYLT